MRTLTTALAVSLLYAASAQAFSVSSLYVFGDSNVDIGRMGDPVPDDGAVPPPNTVGMRTSDGPILPEYLAARVGVPQKNFAFIGATSGHANIMGLFGKADFRSTGTLAQIDESETAFETGAADPGALFLLWAGSNDLVLIDKSNEAETRAAVKGVTANLTQAVRRLAAAGARKIVLATRATRPVLSSSAAPWTLPDLDPSADGVQNPELNDAAGNFLNGAIRRLVPALDAAVSADVLLFDSDAVIRDLIANSGSNGFAPYDAGKAGYCVRNDDCSRLINWDGAHKTSAVHSAMADAFIAQFSLTAAGGAQDIVTSER